MTRASAAHSWNAMSLQSTCCACVRRRRGAVGGVAASLHHLQARGEQREGERAQGAAGGAGAAVQGCAVHVQGAACHGGGAVQIQRQRLRGKLRRRAARDGGGVGENGGCGGEGGGRSVLYYKQAGCKRLAWRRAAFVLCAGSCRRDSTGTTWLLLARGGEVGAAADGGYLNTGMRGAGGALVTAGCSRRPRPTAQLPSDSRAAAGRGWLTAHIPSSWSWPSGPAAGGGDALDSSNCSDKRAARHA